MSHRPWSCRRLALATSLSATVVAACHDATAVGDTPEPVPNQIVFTTERTGNPDVWIMKGDGANPRPITASPAVDQSADLDAFRLLIVFMATRDGMYQVYRMSVTGRALVQLTRGATPNGFPRWSPNGERILYTSLRDDNFDLFTMRPDGTDVRRLTSDPSDDVGGAWSPDGQHIAFVSWRSGAPDIYVMRIDGSDVVRLTYDGGEKGARVAWSPDGLRIAFHTDVGSTADLFVINADGTNLRAITSHPANDRYPVWSPDGSRIAFASDRDGNEEIYVMDAAGSVTRITTSPGRDVPDSWR